MDDDLYDSFDDFEEDLSPLIAQQIARWERQAHRTRVLNRKRREKLDIRRRLEDWQDYRRMREDIDYLH